MLVNLTYFDIIYFQVERLVKGGGADIMWKSGVILKLISRQVSRVSWEEVKFIIRIHFFPIDSRNLPRNEFWNYATLAHDLVSRNTFVTEQCQKIWLHYKLRWKEHQCIFSHRQYMLSLLVEMCIEDMSFPSGNSNKKSDL